MARVNATRIAWVIIDLCLQLGDVWNVMISEYLCWVPAAPTVVLFISLE